MGMLIPSPLLRRVISAGMVGVPWKVFDPLLASEFSLESFPLVAGGSSLVASLAAAAPGISVLRPYLVAS